MMSAVLLLSSVIFLVGAPLTHACTCMPQHPQTLYCQSEFVIVATVEGSVHLPDEHANVYNLTVHAVLKRPVNTLSEELFPAPNATNEEWTLNVSTAMWGSLCGVNLNIGTKYVLGGHNSKFLGLSVNLCGLNLAYKDVPKRLMNGFNRKFEVSCDCEITYCNDLRCAETDLPNGCTHNTRFYPVDCSDKYSMCRRGPNGHCFWTDNKYNRLCQNQLRHRLRV